jgi:hypothetical protein
LPDCPAGIYFKNHGYHRPADLVRASGASQVCVRGREGEGRRGWRGGRGRGMDATKIVLNSTGKEQNAACHLTGRRRPKQARGWGDQRAEGSAGCKQQAKCRSLVPDRQRQCINRASVTAATWLRCSCPGAGVRRQLKSMTHSHDASATPKEPPVANDTTHVTEGEPVFLPPTFDFQVVWTKQCAALPSPAGAA